MARDWCGEECGINGSHSMRCSRKKIAYPKPEPEESGNSQTCISPCHSRSLNMSRACEGNRAYCGVSFGSPAKVPSLWQRPWLAFSTYLSRDRWIVRRTEWSLGAVTTPLHSLYA